MQQKAYTISEAIAELEKIQDKNQLILLSEWAAEDIDAQLNDLKEVGRVPKSINFTEEDYTLIFSLLDKYHDASIGLNWHFIDSIIELYLESK